MRVRERGLLLRPPVHLVIQAADLGHPGQPHVLAGDQSLDPLNTPPGQAWQLQMVGNLFSLPFA